MASRAGFKFYAGSLHRLLGQIAPEKNPEQVREPFAAPQLEASILILQGIKAENELASALAAYGRLCKRRGRVADARDYLTRTLKIFERLGTMIEPEKVRTELAGSRPCGPHRVAAVPKPRACQRSACSGRRRRQDPRKDGHAESERA
jgi:hypothetical protein